ncbi:cobalt/nickel transport system ATP-binding protein [Clostridium acetobutylicum]|uniref:Putative ABC transporter ATP-binding protein CA_C0773 n=1 Tax=Clostridium acetobutylicum (strain ATCC 824 / DSM 792 / JCM 1419 / IAM 19013 / LMG 5710 / NBRC 13948 / NRRL B-527 / VKM B-1787 / 2291 / W) TaxID=272562 RepID=Y773_CLOAB|nr:MULTISPECIES: ABC transporter ATP-binding protein [Clostridium]Q97KZ3.1 RecName: Full=Putative ABC transporter ATP-binding protein CA_C0773 [Clostridium acetobutylicum ATCC 824]AAK78749.1 ABC-type cobalt transport protein ATPase component [Clostridium acetobutylicum ATCC 824]ADZ19823.1 ABC-type cobalt transport protein ATPase component [Clostridium acetobutylicum EA 2018]AEI33285.1 ABC-type cobalt transport protein ATPase component [Clostridium acetobutylicum DSM 1731]AWV80467.1 ABC transpo
MIKLEKVSFTYKNRAALCDVNVDINEGEAVAIIGPNGSGKSTFLKVLNGILFPSSGRYVFDNNEINENTLKNNKFLKLFHKRVGFVFQNSDAQLFCSTVFDEVAFGIMQMGLEGEEVDKRVRDCLKLLNIEKLKEEHPYNLSGGEKKRVAIASVLAMNPEVITLDEPMNAIDPKGKRFLKELLIDLNKSGKTIICATHDFEYIEGVFNRAVVFSENHKIIRDDRYENIISDREFLMECNII